MTGRKQKGMALVVVSASQSVSQTVSQSVSQSVSESILSTANLLKTAAAGHVP